MKALPKNATTDFAEPLVRFVEIDRDGHASFNYPGATGALRATINSIADRLKEAAAARGAAAKTEKLKEALDYVEQNCAEQGRIEAMWSEHMAAHGDLLRKAMGAA